jgi:hypothetical protein
MVDCVILRRAALSISSLCAVSIAAVSIAAVSIATASVVVAAPTSGAGDVPEDVPPSKRVYMITDSVGLGAKSALANAFGPNWLFTMDADAGEFTETLESKYVRPRLSQTPGVFGDYAIVATGYNYPYWDPTRFANSIDSMIATLTEAGVKHVFWVTLREVDPQYVTPAAWRQIQPYYWYFPTVNDHLQAAVERHPNLTLIDWAAVANQSGLTYDAIHLNTFGAALYAATAREAIVNRQTAAGERSVTRVPIPNAAGTAAVAVNLTTVGPRALGFLTAYDCSRPMPEVSNHNFTRDLTVAHSAIVPVDSGELCVFNNVSSNLVVDITGRFEGASTIADATSTRLVDTRQRGTLQPALTPLEVTVAGAGSTAPVVLSVTAVDAGGPGWVRAAPCDATDTTSTLNVDDAAPVPNVAVVEPGPSGTVCVTASVATHLIVDRFLAFGPDAEIDVVRPRRVLDTREGAAVPVAASGVAVLDAAALGVTTDTTGVMLNLTVTDASGPGFLTAYPCDAGRPTTSNLNFVAGDVVANFVVVEPDADGDVCVYAHTMTHVVVDLLGTLNAGFTGGAPLRLLDTRVANLPLDWP